MLASRLAVPRTARDTVVTPRGGRPDEHLDAAYPVSRRISRGIAAAAGRRQIHRRRDASAPNRGDRSTSCAMRRRINSGVMNHSHLHALLRRWRSATPTCAPASGARSQLRLAVGSRARTAFAARPSASSAWAHRHARGASWHLTGAPHRLHYLAPAHARGRSLDYETLLQVKRAVVHVVLERPAHVRRAYYSDEAAPSW